MPALRRPAYFVYRKLWSALDWLYPPQCGGCGSPGTRWCTACQHNAPKISPQVCPCCGQPQPRARLCHPCQVAPPHFKAVRSWAEFRGPVQAALHRLKYRKDMALGDALAQNLISLYHQLNWKIDLVASVPLGVARLAERGYNQATLLALPLALELDLPFHSRAVSRVRETGSQVNLNRKERRQNVSGAFRADRRLVEKCSVLVVDDVMTSGATLDACASALLDAGAEQVWGLTLARAVLIN